MSTINACPKCGHAPSGEQVSREECPACGIVFAKFLAVEERRQAAAAADDGAAGKERAPLPLSTVSNITIAAAVVILLVRAFYKPLPPLFALLMVPFYFCGVCVLSWFVSGGVYVWDKWKGHFEFLDAEEHPVKCLFMMVFCAGACAAAVFALFYIPET